MIADSPFIETIYRKKQAKNIFAQIPEWSRIIIMPALEKTARFNEDSNIINEEITKVRLNDKTPKIKNNYSAKLYLS